VAGNASWQRSGDTRLRRGESFSATRGSRDTRLKLLVVSDTHIPDRLRELPEDIMEAAEDADGIIHAGDFTGEEALWLFRGMTSSFYAVRGNMDAPGVARVLNGRLVFELEGLRIGLIHGSGPPDGLYQRVRRLLPEDLDVLVFGHSHVPVLENDGGLLVLNPGSPSSGRRSYALLFIEGGKARGELRYL